MNYSTTDSLASARSRLELAEGRHNQLVVEAQKRVAGLPDTATVADVDAVDSEFRSKLDAAEASVSEARKAVETAQSIAEARSAVRGLFPVDFKEFRVQHDRRKLAGRAD